MSTSVVPFGMIHTTFFSKIDRTNEHTPTRCRQNIYPNLRPLPSVTQHTMLLTPRLLLFLQPNKNQYIPIPSSLYTHTHTHSLAYYNCNLQQILSERYTRVRTFPPPSSTMEDIKGKAVEVGSGDMADVGLPIQGMGPPMRGDQRIGFHQENGSNRVGALRRLSELRARRRLAAAAAEGFGSASVMQRHFVPKPIRPPPPPTTEVNPFTAQFLFEKELKCSDVGPACRIVIPKGYAERYLPALTDKEGFFVFMDDMDACEIWVFRYRYWQNNHSRMFVLEKTGDFVRAHGLQSGDFMMVYKDGQSERFGIRARKASSQVTGPQHELNRSRNYYADLTAMNGTCFPPENVLYNSPMKFTAEDLRWCRMFQMSNNH
ncbi:hypothetical protein RHMOL_Rhmol12G0107400 [Rhododendron molle]|uniref:Uncharacterized protein n=1 Tax=Rhododendron molle TaxID=49168 RepID=A0ACC0LGX2_RHOML|nr:hypothetical protein RHMOL_Rhmol12G0107400 [Rhododendron molle]